MLSKIFKTFLMSALVFALAVSVYGCKKAEKTETVAPAAEEIIYVGTNAEFPPFGYLENGEMVGFDIDLINEIAKTAGKKIEIKNMAFDGLLPAMQVGKIDVIISGMTVTDERKKSVNFSDTYFISKQAILINEDNQNIKSFEDLPKNKVGVVLGYTGDLIVTEMGGPIERFNADSQAILALNSKKVDAVVIDSEPARNYAKYNKGLKVIETDLAEEEYAIAVNKDKPELLNDINNALRTLRENGTYDALMEKYFSN